MRKSDTQETDMIFSGYLSGVVYGVKVLNSSGSAATTGDAGYLDADNAYQTTTTAEDEQPNAVAVTLGGANGADIYVTRGPGRMTLNYTGSAPSSGDFLEFSGTAGQVQTNSTVMHPGIVARARANGSGGTVAVELLCQTLSHIIAPANNIYEGSGADSDFVALIDSLPGGAAVRYDTPTSGDETNLVPSSTSQIAKIVLHNTTQGDSALISDCDTTGGAGYDGEITLTDTVPGTWQVGDTITIRSQTNTATVGSSYFVDMQFVSDVSDLARTIIFSARFRDTGAAGEFLMFHPYETNDNQKRRLFLCQVANTYFDREIILPLISSTFCCLWTGSGSGTARFTLRMDKEEVAG